ncbi:MAG: cysteine--tRNA ligase, partial [Muribaculaceae bacterium]|nr:cysteine--tRNA ligase [Muribaculaceae bacterium]
KCYEAMDDDLNTPMVIAQLFDACTYINKASDGLITLSAEDIDKLKSLFNTFLVDLLGIRVDSASAAGEGNSAQTKAFEGAVDLLMDVRKNAKAAKDWATSDFIRDRLAALGFDVKDTKNGVEWKIKS